MEVSFKGINNLYIGKKTYSKFGSYLSHNGQIKQGQKNYTDILIRCNLVDDARGDDFKEFLKTLEKCRKHYQTDCINMQNPSQIRLVMQHFSVPDGTNVQNSNFKINDCDILLTERKALPLFTFIAKLTRIIAFAKGPSEAYKNCAKFVNAAAHNEAMNFIENLM